MKRIVRDRIEWKNRFTGRGRFKHSPLNPLPPAGTAGLDTWRFKRKAITDKLFAPPEPLLSLTDKLFGLPAPQKAIHARQIAVIANRHNSTRKQNCFSRMANCFNRQPE
ncbi:hypothetical protein QLH52_09225 [Methylomonas sp. OY6]|uniref:Uncharacterized protein n=1 Tax=Methylomonas defluvii TaxID=3045149 RepID=A0ABU4UDD1_9GAMM|nr:hypothetical protein [Methylomonas sp. OY6]MDX8127462.1 hypothetical protein [Methylomonas sp. OY6]